MNKKSLKTHRTLLAFLALGLCAALPAPAQPFGGFAPGGSTTRSTSRGASGTTRQYPGTGAVGDAYFSIDPETRRVVTIADEDTMRYISQVLSNLDRPKPQVLIKVVFLELTYNNASDIGIEGGWGKGWTSSLTNSAVSGFGLSALSSVVSSNVNQFGQPISSFSAASPMTQPGAGLYQIAGQDYAMTFKAIAQAGKAKILSRPQILARNNQPATILVGQRYPTVTSISYGGANNNLPISSIVYQEIGVVLKVTPFITSDGMVEMIVSPQISAVDQTVSVQISAGVTANAITTRQADTVAVTPDGQTVIIGGLIQDSKGKAVTKIPLLGDIPLLGYAFRREQKTDTKTELIIFLTPHIVQAPSELASLSASEREKMDSRKSFSESELNRYLDDLPQKDSSPDKTQPPGKKSSGSGQQNW